MQLLFDSIWDFMIFTPSCSTLSKNRTIWSMTMKSLNYIKNNNFLYFFYVYVKNYNENQKLLITRLWIIKRGKTIKASRNGCFAAQGIHMWLKHVYQITATFRQYKKGMHFSSYFKLTRNNISVVVPLLTNIVLYLLGTHFVLFIFSFLIIQR